MFMASQTNIIKGKNSRILSIERDLVNQNLALTANLFQVLLKLQFQVSQPVRQQPFLSHTQHQSRSVLRVSAPAQGY